MCMPFLDVFNSYLQDSDPSSISVERCFYSDQLNFFPVFKVHLTCSLLLILIVSVLIYLGKMRVEALKHFIMGVMD